MPTEQSKTRSLRAIGRGQTAGRREWGRIRQRRNARIVEKCFWKIFCGNFTRHRRLCRQIRRRRKTARRYDDDYRQSNLTETLPNFTQRKF